MAMDSGRFEEAVALFEQSVAISPHFKTLELLGECLVALGRLQVAIVPLAAAATLNNGSRAPALLAEVFLQTDQIYDAERMVEIALNRDPANKRAVSVKNTLAVAKTGRQRSSENDTD